MIAGSASVIFPVVRWPVLGGGIGPRALFGLGRRRDARWRSTGGSSSIGITKGGPRVGPGSRRQSALPADADAGGAGGTRARPRGGGRQRGSGRGGRRAARARPA